MVIDGFHHHHGAEFGQRVVCAANDLGLRAFGVNLNDINAAEVRLGDHVIQTDDIHFYKFLASGKLLR